MNGVRMEGLTGEDADAAAWYLVKLQRAIPYHKWANAMAEDLGEPEPPTEDEDD